MQLDPVTAHSVSSSHLMLHVGSLATANGGKKADIINGIKKTIQTGQSMPSAAKIVFKP